jgi:hypothetical protein
MKGAIIMISFKGIFCVLSLAAIAAGACNTSVSCISLPFIKNNAPLGNNSTLPDGYCAYDHGTTSGLTVTPLKIYQPVNINAAINDYPTNIEISDNGEWILYWTPKQVLGLDRQASYTYPARLILVKKDGSGYTEIPTGGKLKAADATNCVSLGSGFVRRSPNGVPANQPGQTKTEIWYAGSRNMYALKVDLSQTPPVFGTERTLLHLDSADDANSWSPRYLNGGPYFGGGVSGNHIFYSVDPASNHGYCFTVPNNGSGTANWKDRYPLEITGCGFGLAQDGSFFIKNEALSSPTNADQCWPTGHDGFHLYEFLENSAPVYSNLEMDFCHQISTNRSYGGLFYVHCYGGTNDRNYITAQFQGIWLINWPNNIWYRICTAEAPNVAVYFGSATNTAGGKLPIMGQKRIALMNGAGACYDIRGRITRSAGSLAGRKIPASKGVFLVVNGKTSGILVRDR